MTTPVVVITRSAAGEMRTIEWFEDERRAYAGDPFRRMTFNPVTHVWSGRSLRKHRFGLQVDWQAAVTLWRLTQNPWADVSDVATHTVAEPGAPLDPIDPVVPIARPLGGVA